ncbi:MAG TPA: hypothetical protein VFZ48_01930 [Candidatus Saccharimonadales bacterium]
MEFFGLAAGIVGIVGYAPYIKDTLKGVTKPDRAAWGIWTLEYVALFFAQLSEGATHSLWLIGLQLLGVLIVCGLSFRFGVGTLTKQTVGLFACVCAALIVWYFTKSAATAILILLLVEASGVVLTIRKTYQQPQSETLTMWICVALAGLLGVGAVVGGAPILYVYPISLIVMSAGVMVASWLGARRYKTELSPSTV